MLCIGEVIDILFTMSGDVTKTTSNIVDKLLSRADIHLINSDLEKLKSLIKAYRYQGAGLEKTAKEIDLLLDPSFNNTPFDFPRS